MQRISLENRYGDDKVYDACGLIGIMDTTGQCFSGHDIVKGITNMNERGNGLGSGYAVYGCYPDYADCYAFHVMFTNPDNQSLIETRLQQNFILVHDEEVPHNFIPDLYNPPLIWRYFLRLDESNPECTAQDPSEYVVSRVMDINIAGLGAYIYSSGKNMGAFKGVGLPDQIAEYFSVEDYDGYLWTAHNRFPTNTPGWWGGAHPFGLLDWTVVHNGEISSYGTNRRFLEMQGYHCTMSTDTEVMAYAVDFLIRRHKLPVEIATRVMSAPLWEEIERMSAEEQALSRTLRQVYGGLLINGPFTIIVARQGEMIGLTDRIRLRPMVAATRGERLYISSEEASIRLVDQQIGEVWTPVGGQPVIGRLGEVPKSPRQPVHIPAKRPSAVSLPAG
ncbi:MAG: glutamine amidotransferase family protein [Anaerolineae bacterium]|nr:glutamine amidotransferase family protein [Anaerolineae bacterium]